MKATIKNKLFSLAILLAFSSCKKYLDKIPDDSLFTPTTIVDLQRLLDNSSQMNLSVTPSFGEASADNYFLERATYDAAFFKGVYKWSPELYMPFYSGTSNDWAKSYLPVYNSNLCLDQLKKIEKTSQNGESWNKVKGSALFFKAHSFLNLAWTFAKAYDKTTANGDMGIDLRMTSDYTVPSVRSSVEQTYQRIISDAKEAIQYLPATSEHVFRPSKAAVYGLLARTYLSMREYDSAFTYANLCLAIKSNLLDYTTVASVNVPFAPYAYSTTGEVIFHTTMWNSFAYSLISQSLARIDSSFYSMYAATDLRRSLFFRASGNYQQFKGTYYTAVSQWFSGITTAEMYLIRAECAARAGDKTSALADLNSLLRKRYTAAFTDVTAADAPAALEIILRERRKELVMRGLRWIDIKRLNKEGRNITPTRLIAAQLIALPPNDNRYALPLPRDIIEITGMPQNEY